MISLRAAIARAAIRAFCRRSARRSSSGKIDAAGSRARRRLAIPRRRTYLADERYVPKGGTAPCLKLRLHRLQHRLPNRRRPHLSVCTRRMLFGIRRALQNRVAPGFSLCKTVLPRDFVAIGDSFGANLLLSACLRARDDGLPLPSALVCVCSYIDMAASGNSYRDNCHKDPLYALPKRCDFETHEKDIQRISPYCGNTSLTDPYLSPAYADFHAFPQTLIQCGGLETSLSDNRMLFDGLTRSGCPARLHVFNGMWHDFMYMLPRLKESKLAWSEICDFVSAALSGGK